MRATYRILSAALLGSVAVQIFLAGRGIGTGSFAPHRGFAYGVLVLALVTTVAGLVARAPRRAVSCTAGAFALMFLQPVLVHLGKSAGADAGGGLFFGLHALNAVVMVSLLVVALRQPSPRGRPTEEKTARAREGAAS
ncbi:DUF6220 domain-containing protein [Nocardioides sp. zg-1228]|uniref:DUF6220 domain-containing protein n=1 Tax=Nocardioides sp. zg-1228 TaxID=2763008 RepID=UPI001643359A|nr:DUF6220 domain-containing protein [Nocardioides sp. zg-1228]MBC2932834.1 hypothetical protein [Nocardioides sp. zg-1228]QSF56951.1 hypothetical protein JX575_15380 [Nocardioides sp. zg-1228]